MSGMDLVSTKFGLVIATFFQTLSLPAINISLLLVAGRRNMKESASLNLETKAALQGSQEKKVQN